MGTNSHIPLGVGFYPDWFYKHYGISFDEKYYFDPETRVEVRMEMERRLYERFGDVGLGNPNPEPKPLITFGMVMLPAVFGCEIVYEKDALPWAIPLNLSRDQVMRLEPPDILNSYPMTEMLKQIEYLRGKYGSVVGDINTTGIQNLALKIRGDQLYIDYFEDPELCHHLLKICTHVVIELFKFNKKVTGTGAMDVTPMCDPKLCVLPNCTIEQISLATYEKYLLDYDNQVAEACGAIGIHHCGSVDQVLEGYAKVKNLKFIEIGFGSDVKRTREVFGPQVAVNARISPVLMKNGTPQEIAAEVRRLIDQGAPLENFSIDTVGLTYGTPDENVRTARQTAAQYGKIRPSEPEPKEKGVRLGTITPPVSRKTVITSATQKVTIGPDSPFVVIGERINPTGKKALAASIEKGDMGLICQEALSQVEAGAHILDVNVGVSGVDEALLLKQAIKAIQEVTNVPLCIDSADPCAIEAALEAYEGMALVNSVNGEKEKLDKILPLVKEHDAVVIGLTMDEAGIPKEALKRYDIAARILDEAGRHGIPPERVVIDPLAMAVSADHESAKQTIHAISLIKERLGVNTTLGLSNISFGLPNRDLINSLFLAMAVAMGLDSAIIDPTSSVMRNALLILEMLQGRDPFCTNYLAAFKKSAEAQTSTPPIKPFQPPDKDELEALKEAIIQGRRKDAVRLTKMALEKGADPQVLINDYMIPALNVVGERFEKRKIFIPEMMMAAKSMQACMDVINPLLEKETEEILGTVVLGTVFGDLHDIGKNLVKLLLETSGFRVIDLGENVPPERFVEAAREHNAHIVGLSSLLTTGDPYVEETIKVIKQSDIGERVKVICGGAALTLKFVKACGADAYAKDAAEGVKKVKNLLGIQEA